VCRWAPFFRVLNSGREKKNNQTAELHSISPLALLP
jgi:hypothetical protein